MTINLKSAADAILDRVVTSTARGAGRRRHGDRTEWQYL